MRGLCSHGAPPLLQHNDTPYQRLMQRGFPEHGFGPDDSMPPLGLQCNMCIDEYREANGGTMFVPDSYRLGRKPQHEQAPAGAQYERNEYAPPEAQCLTAPPGSVFCYHAATWHRMHPNTTETARLGLLQSFTPVTRGNGLLCDAILYKNRIFAKTGSGRTYEKLTKRPVSAGLHRA